MEKKTMLESVRLPESIDIKLHDMAEDQDRPVSYLIRKAITKMLLARGNGQGKQSTRRRIA